MLPIVDSFGAPTGPISPSQSVRRWDHGVLAGAFGWALGVGAAACVLWRPLPLVGDVPAGGFLPQLMAYPELFLDRLTLGCVFPHAWLDNPAIGPISEWALHLRLLPTWIAGCVVGGALMRRALIPHEMTRHVSGPRWLEGNAAQRAARREAAQARGTAAGFLRLHPLLDLPKRTWCRHVLITGSVGAGKTQVLFPIVQQVIDKKKKLFLVDVKGDYTPALPDAVILSPWDHRSAYWDIAADVRTSAQAAAFAANLIPSDSGSNKFFSTAAEMILVGCVRALQQHADTSWTWKDLDDLLSLSAQELSVVVARSYAKAKPLLSGGGVTAGSVLATLVAHTQTISQLAEAFGDGLDEHGRPRPRVSLVAWANDDYTGCPTIIAQTGPDAALTQRYLAAAVNILVPQILRLPDDVSEEGRAIVIVLDELAAVGKINLAPLIDKGRSKSVAVVIGCQDLVNQVSEIHGSHFAKALPSMVGTHIVGQMQAGPTCTALAEQFGQRRVALTTITAGERGGPVVSEEWRPVVQPTDLRTRLGYREGRRYPNGRAVRLVASLGGDVLALDWPIRAVPHHRPAFVPAAWTCPVGVAPTPAAWENPVRDEAAERALRDAAREACAGLEAALTALAVAQAPEDSAP